MNGFNNILHSCGISEVGDATGSMVKFKHYIGTLENELVEIAKGCNYATCSGCHETIDGQETGNYPFDKMRGIIIGSGCDECKEKGYLIEDNTGREDFYSKQMGLVLEKELDKLKEDSSYEKIENILKSLPMTYYPALIQTMIQVAIGKGVFLKDKAHVFVKQIEDKYPS